MFDSLLSTVQITSEEELLLRKAANEVLEQLRRRHPDQDFAFDEKGIRGKNQAIYLGNLYRELQAAPKRRETIIKSFVENLSLSADAGMGHEVWEEVRGHIIPVLKPQEYIKPDSPTQHLLTTEWLVNVLICYVIRSKKFYRFVTPWDVGRWGTDSQTLHDIAMTNLAQLPWPSRMEGSRQKDGGRVILVDTEDNLASSRILHPDLHRLFSGPLGSPFWAGIPDRDTLVLYSDRRSLKQRIRRRLSKDCQSSAYAITPRPFLVTRDGIAPESE